MRKVVPLLLLVLSAVGTSACAQATPEHVEGMIKSGDEIDGMLFSSVDTLDWNYSLHFLCDLDPVEETADSATLRCSTQPGGRVYFGNCGGVVYETPEEADEQWQAFKIEVTFDGRTVDLPSFGYLDTEFPEDPSMGLRMWNLMVENITPGSHTVQCKQESEEGTFTGIFALEVSEKQGTFPALSSGPAPRIHVYTSEDGEVNYLLYVPDDYGADSQKKWPLLIYLHGRTRAYSDVIALEDDYPLNTLADDGSFPFVVVAPKSSGEYHQWASDEQVQSAMTVVDEAQAELSVDPDRIYLTGGSGGGNGVWVISLRYPDRFAALVPFMGYYGYPFSVPDNICDIENVPVWAFHGDADEVVPLDAEQSIVDALTACGGDVQFTIFPDIGHDMDYSLVYNSDLYAWLLSHARDTQQK